MPQHCHEAHKVIRKSTSAQGVRRQTAAQARVAAAEGAACELLEQRVRERGAEGERHAAELAAVRTEQERVAAQPHSPVPLPVTRWHARLKHHTGVAAAPSVLQARTPYMIIPWI